MMLTQNNLPKDEKIRQVSKYMDDLRGNFKAHCIFERERDIDECMVEYFGRYGMFLRQSIKTKPK